MDYAFDSHLHVLPINHASLLAYLSFVQQNKVEESLAVFNAKNYIFGDVIQNPERLLNMLAIIENKTPEIIQIYEDDLRGKFVSPEKFQDITIKKIKSTLKEQVEKVNVSNKIEQLPKHIKQKAEKVLATIQEEEAILSPLLDDKGIHIGNKTYSKLIICPQIMDFNIPGFVQNIYYNKFPKHDTLTQANEILEGIYSFRSTNKDSPIIVRPFLGINPQFWEIGKIEEVLHTHFKNFQRGENQMLKTWERVLSEYPSNKNNPYANAFAGVKLYPPMGFDPWPDNKNERDKVELIYSYCEKHKIPITTHCDDQGFRMIQQEQSFKQTSPVRWQKVLEIYPKLYLDIAHFGQQYNTQSIKKPEDHWQTQIIKLLIEYPNVYSDLSFDGVNKDFWNSLENLGQEFPQNGQDLLETRLLFGTDWPLCLSKIESLASYWHGFNNASISDEYKHKIISTNPYNFLIK